MTKMSINESGNKVKGEIRVKKIISARVIGGMAAMLLVVASIIGLNQQTDTAQAAATGTINLVNNWSKLSTATSPSKLATGYGGTTPSYVGSGKSLYATYTSTGRHIMTGSNQLIIEVVDADLNDAIVKSTMVLLKGGHTSSSTLITNYKVGNNSSSEDEYAIPIIDNNSDGIVNGQDLSFACRWLGSGYHDEGALGGSTDPETKTGIDTGFYSAVAGGVAGSTAATALSTPDSLLDGTVLKNGGTGGTVADVLTDARAATTTLGQNTNVRTDMTVDRGGVTTDEDALMGLFNAAPKCSTGTSSKVSVSLAGSAGDPILGVSAQITIATPSSIVDASLIFDHGTAYHGTPDAATNDNEAATAAAANTIAGLVQWKTSRINTTTVKVWSGVVSESNAINILLTETGRNTGVFNGLVNLFDNENTAMPLGMAVSQADDTTDAASILATAYVGSFGNTHAESPCADDCAAGLNRAATSDTSTLAVKDGGTVYAEYIDADDADANTSQKRQITAKVDATTPTVEINSPAHSSENQTRTPTFSLTATEAASGLDVSGALLILQEGAETNNSGEDGSVGANGTDVMSTSDLHDGAGDDDGNGGEWLTSSIFALTGGDITLGSSVDEASSPVTRTAASVTVNRGTSTDGVSSLTYTYTPSSALPLGAATPVDHWIDFQGVATDLAGNVGYTDSDSSVSAGVLNKFGASHIKIDQKLPSISAAYTGWWWDTSIDSKNKTHKHTSTKANSMVVEFDGNITGIDATDFQITFDDGTTHTPSEAVIYTALPTQVFLTLAASMPADDTPKVALVGSVSDIAGNSTSSGSLAGATDKIHPSVTATLSGGTGTGTGALETANDLTKSTIVVTVTTDEELVSNPKVDVYDLGMAGAGGDAENAYKGTCGVVNTCGADSSNVLVDGYNIRTLNVAADPPVTSFTQDRNGADQGNDGFSTATASSTSAGVILDASMTAQGTKTFKYTINAANGSPGTDGEKTVVITATDKATQGNITIHGSISSTSSYLRFMLDDTAPVLAITPAADSTTTQTKPYIVLDYSAEEATKVTLNTATLDGVDISGELSTTDNKKFYYVPTTDLAAGSHTIVAKATDFAGTVSSIQTKKFTVAARKDFKLSLLAGWNAKSVPSDPVDPSIDSVFSNAGVDMVLSYSDHTWSSATKDAESGKFVGSLSEIHSGHGYWIHNNNFESQSVALVGPVAPSAGSPPAVVTIPTVAGWNFVGVSDVTRANTEGADGTTIDTAGDYFGDLKDAVLGGHDIVYSYDTTNLKFVEVLQGGNVSTGQGLWIYIVPAADGSILPIVPPAP
jgi:hypothetical protein